jgi:heme/copper-type cytochrome/quinol oxidase subunit 2
MKKKSLNKSLIFPLTVLLAGSTISAYAIGAVFQIQPPQSSVSMGIDWMVVIIKWLVTIIGVMITVISSLVVYVFNDVKKQVTIAIEKLDHINNHGCLLYEAEQTIKEQIQKGM